MPVSTISTTVITMAGLRYFIGQCLPGCLLRRALSEVERSHDEVNRFDPDKRDYHTADSVEDQVARQDLGCAHGPVRDPAQRQRDQADDNQRVEDDGG